MSELTLTLIDKSYEDVNKGSLGALYNDAPAPEELPGRPYYCVKEVTKDSFKIGLFKKIPLNWVVIDDRANEPEIDVTESGIDVYLSRVYDDEDKDWIVDWMKEYKYWIRNLYKKACDVEIFKKQVKKIVDDVCRVLNAEYDSIELYSKEKRHTTGYCVPSTKTLYFDLAMMTMPYDYIYSTVAHECCHLKIGGHNDDFWELFETVDLYDDGEDGWYVKYGFTYYDYPYGSGFAGRVMGYNAFRANKNIKIKPTFSNNIIVNKS